MFADSFGTYRESIFKNLNYLMDKTNNNDSTVNNNDSTINNNDSDVNNKMYTRILFILLDKIDEQKNVIDLSYKEVESKNKEIKTLQNEIEKMKKDIDNNYTDCFTEEIGGI